MRAEGAWCRHSRKKKADPLIPSGSCTVGGVDVVQHENSFPRMCQVGHSTQSSSILVATERSFPGPRNADDG